MIFVTVGTDDHKFDRLIKHLDNLRAQNKIKDDIFIQIGPTSIEPKHCEFQRMLTYEKMEYYYNKADTLIVHGGPGSIFNCLLNDKIPIVVPRDPRYEEVIDDHQIIFCEKLASENKINLCLDLSKLDLLIEESKNQSSSKKLLSNLNMENFVERLEKEIKSIF